MRRLVVLGLLAVCAGVSLYPVQAGAQEPTCNGRTATTTGSYGTSGDDVFVGGEGNDRFYDDGGGNDTICSGGGDDWIFAGPGDDYVDAGPGNDRVSSCSDPFSGERCVTGDDADTFLGGAGDDALFGLVDADSLDGGDGFDAIDGGDAADACSGGERYEACETADPPEEPAACANGGDDDGDGYADFADPGCSRSRDPTEDVTDDPKCFNGNDDDGDGYRDFPADPGCTSATDKGEYECIDTAACVAPYVTARYKRRDAVFKGVMYTFRDGCTEGRTVLVRRLRPGRNPLVARTVTGADGRWRVAWSGGRGRFVAIVPRSSVTTSEGDEPWCEKLRSGPVKVGRG